MHSPLLGTGRLIAGKSYNGLRIDLMGLVVILLIVAVIVVIRRSRKRHSGGQEL